MRIDKIKYNHRPRLLYLLRMVGISGNSPGHQVGRRGGPLAGIGLPGPPVSGGYNTLRRDTSDKLVVRGLCGLAYLPGMAREVRHLHRHQWHTPSDR